MMELPSPLHKKIVHLLSSLPIMHSRDGQQALIYNADLDSQLQQQISFGSPVALFVPLLVRKLTEYGTLKDGRHALVAVLESAKLYMGQKKQNDCDALIQNVQQYILESAADQEQSQTQSQLAAGFSTSCVQIILEGDSERFDKTKRRDLVNVIAALLEIDRQFVRILHVQPGSVQVIIKLPTDQARKLVALFYTRSGKLDPLRQQFFVKLITVLNTLREIAWLSDIKLLPEAEQFVQQFLERHPAITKKKNPLAATQINGLENYITSAETTQLLEEYIEHQKTKAKRNENPRSKNKDYYLARYYEQLEERVHALRVFIGEHPETFPDSKSPAQQQWYHYYLVKEFVQHLIADYNFRIQLR